MTTAVPNRGDLASLYLDQLPFDPYPVQEEALLAWFSTDTGVLVCTPTGTGKTLIAEAAAFEALHSRKVIYYTTPLIALTEQKFDEMQAAAVRWGFPPEDIGLVTGNRRVNPGARVLVVVAEILLNRLLHSAEFRFEDVDAVVMDEFHSFADPERGIVWELSLALLPEHVRLLLLSATVGNSAEFIHWLYKSHGRRLDLVQSTDRRVPLTYQWVPDKLLNEQVEVMADGVDGEQRTPALVFCFNREMCWSVAEQLKGRRLLSGDQRKDLAVELEKFDWTKGGGRKLKPILERGVGVHHAGILPTYRRIVEGLFQRKLLTIVVCTETLSAGINLPARAVVVISLLKGPPGKKKLMDASAAHQMFGRAGRPQFDDQGFVYAMAHEDDVKLLRWQEQYDQIPETTKDAGLLKAKKALKKKMPTRRKTEQYWNFQQFEKLIAAPAGKLYSRGPLPWRLLAYLLSISPDVDLIRNVIRKRLMDSGRIEAGEKALDRMLMTLWGGGYVTLEPEPPAPGAMVEEEAPEPTVGLLNLLIKPESAADEAPKPVAYRPSRAHATPALERLLVFRSISPIYGDFLVQRLGIADRNERLQAFESALDIPGSMQHLVRVPPPEEMPPGPLATMRLDTDLLQRGLLTADQLNPNNEDLPPWERRRAPTLVEKLLVLFEADFPSVEVFARSVWIAGELFRFQGDFNRYVAARDLAKQEGIVFRHILRLTLLCSEFAQVCPPDTTPEEWGADLRDISEQLTATCRDVDPTSTDKLLSAVNAADIVKGETAAEG